MLLSSFSVDHLVLNMYSTTLESSFFLQGDSLGKKLNFYLQVSIEYIKLLGLGGVIYTLLLSVLGPHLVQTCPGPVHIASVSVSVMCINHVDLKGHVFLVSPHLLWFLLAFYFLFHRDSWALRGGI